MIIDLQDDRIQKDSNDQSIHNFGYDDMQNIISKVESSAQQKHKQITDKAVNEIAACDQEHWHLNIFRIKLPCEFTVRITDIHEYKRIKPDHIRKKDVY